MYSLVLVDDICGRLEVAANSKNGFFGRAVMLAFADILALTKITFRRRAFQIGR